jgi:hypothetical protein
MLKYIENALNKTNKHKNVKHAKDIWHISKNLPARWTSFINKKKKESQKKLDTKMFDEVKKLDTTKLKTHWWYWATQQLEPSEFKEKICNVTQY